MNKIALITVIVAGISASAHAGGFGAGFAGGVVGGLVAQGIDAAVHSGQPRTVVIEKQVVVHERAPHHAHHATKAKDDPTPDPKADTPKADPPPKVDPTPTGEVQAPVVTHPVEVPQQAPQKIDNPDDVPMELIPLLTDKNTVIEYLEKFFRDTNPNVTLSDSSLFIEVQIGAYHYLIAKISVNSQQGSVDQGFVIDLKNNHSATLNLDNYHEFLQTGNVNLLGEHHLDPLS